ncbi:cell division transport system permease protein [Pseudomonas duriflava]|uniref:Cell division protein FtsX n=1 Tax=Pseudomonas duriflava TaxID=459528 RepID=A0A562QBM3_9PSED|nr:permease-like cell division protein FtsX [Pseudomonas duriflava]TWI54142.1 cell division transport system permease protein [Pseudomonas duriflava]
MSAKELPRGEVQGEKPQRPKHSKPAKPTRDWRSPLHAYFEAHRTGLRDSLWRMARQPIGSFLTCLVMGIALALPMGVSLLLSNVERLGGSWQRAAQISVFLDLNIQEEQGKQLQEQITALPDVVNVRWIGRDEALQELQQQAGLGEALKELPENPLPSVISVTPREIDKGRLDMLRSQLAELPGVQQVQLDMQWVERLTAILKLGERFVFGLTVILIVALLLVIGNTIRLAIENRRTEIEVIKLVGGTDGYVRRPFLYMGALYGVGAGVAAWGLLAFGLDWLNEAVIDLAGLYGSDFALAGVSFDEGMQLLIGAILLGYIGAWLAVARHLRELAPR